MRKEVVSYLKLVVAVTFAAVAANAALMAGGCSRTAARDEKAGSSSAAAVVSRKADAAPAIRISSKDVEAAEPAITAGAAPSRQTQTGRLLPRVHLRMLP